MGAWTGLIWSRIGSGGGNEHSGSMKWNLLSS
jgi:hypothetical protein